MQFTDDHGSAQAAPWFFGLPPHLNAQPLQTRIVPKRHGYTLLELMLVLALLVIIASLVLPPALNSFQSQRLRKSGEMIRGAWGKSRVRAMQSGRVYVFRYELGGRNFRIEPWFQQQDVLQLGVTDSMTMPGAGVAGGAPPSAALAGSQTTLGELPEGIVFGEVGIAEDTRSMTLEQGTMQSMQQTDQAASTLSVPIIFYPDGTSSDAQLALMSEDGYQVLVQLRSLTGLSKVSKRIAPGRPLVMQ